MRAEMDQRVAFCDVTQPQIERDVTVPRRSSGIVIFGGTVRAPAAIGLQRHQRVAAMHRLENKIAVVELRVALRCSPLRLEVGDQRRVEAGEKAAVFFKRPADRLGFQPTDQRGAVGRNIGDAVAAVAQNIEHLDAALRRVEADSMRHLVVAPRIGRQNDGQTLVGMRGSPQRNPGAGARDNGGDASIIAAMNPVRA